MTEDAELLADFLTEASELTAGLGPALMALAQAPQDSPEIHALFRTFHTLKGSAGFLALDPLVGLCHRAEDLCALLRGGAPALAEDIDALSAAIDTLEAQLDALQAGHAAPPAAPALLQALAQRIEAPRDAAIGTDGAASADGCEAESVPADEDFEALLDAAHGVSAPAASAEDDFEALLDAAHGMPETSDGGAAIGASRAVTAPDPAVAKATSPEAAADVPSACGSTAQNPAAAGGGPVAPASIPPATPPAAESSVRVETARLDAVMDLVGELVLARNALLARQAQAAGPGRGGRRDKTIATLDRVTADLQSAVMRIRMQPLHKLFGRFPRIVRDLARSLGREVTLELEGAQTELDKNVVEALSEPLVHLVRNAVDHGIEAPEAREAAGKPRAGRVRLSARAQGDHVLIRLEDDGAGMDANALRAKAIQRGLIGGDAAATLDASACLQLIFLPGFSTRDAVSDVSGRGVGMDVVKTRIDALGGEIELHSEPGRGSEVTLRLPLTLAILGTLMVVVGERIFALPLAAVDEVRRLDTATLGQLDGRPVLMLDEEPLPVFDLGLWLPGNAPYGQGSDRSHAVILRSGSQRFALVGARVSGREEVVIKPLDESLAQAAAFSGATVTGDGRIALVVDPAGLLKSGPLPPIPPAGPHVAN